MYVHTRSCCAHLHLLVTAPLPPPPPHPPLLFFRNHYASSLETEPSLEAGWPPIERAVIETCESSYLSPPLGNDTMS